MSKKVYKYVDANGNEGYHFHCPGCNSAHLVYTKQVHLTYKVPIWGFNGNEEKPTFTPSVKISWEHSSPGNAAKADAFYKKHNRNPTREELPYDLHEVCHSFVRDGMIQYLGDCTHHLKGQTVELDNF
jgi:hypothetical protein